jgi:hypothetical protein
VAFAEAKAEAPMGRRWPFLLLLVLLTVLFAWGAYRGEVGQEYGPPVTREERPCLYCFLMGMMLFALLAGWGLLLLPGW